MPITIHSKEAVNTGRQPEIDWSKAIAIVCMIIVHTCKYYSAQYIFSQDDIFSTLDSTLYYCFSLLGSAAAAFMICLGIGLVYSKRSSFSYLFKRGIILLIAGLILNILVRIPTNIAYGITSGTMPDNLLYFIFESDILIFAGYVFIFFALVKKWNWNNLTVFLIALILFIVSLLIPGDLFEEGSIIGVIVGSIIPLDISCSDFTFTNWLIYPVLGYLFGQLLIQTTNKIKLYKQVFIISVLVFALLIGFLLLLNVDLVQVFYYFKSTKESPICVIGELCFCGFCLSLIYQLSMALKKYRISSFVTDMSKKITEIYFIQWILISWSYCILIVSVGYFVIPFPFAIILSLVFIALSYALASLFIKIKMKTLKKTA